MAKPKSQNLPKATKKVREEDLRRNYEDLANAIVIRACVDYQNEDGKTAKSKMRKDSIVDFFHSELFGLITSIDPDDLIKRLDKGSKMNYYETIERMRGERNEHEIGR